MHRALLVFAVAASCALAQNTPPGRRTVGRYRNGQPIVINTLAGPSSDAYLEGVLVRVAGSARVAVGLERPRESGAAAVDAGPAPVLLSGRTVDDALGAILAAAARRKMIGVAAPHHIYRLNWTHGVAHVSAFSGTPTLLDVVVPSFSVRNLPLENAVETLLFQMHVKTSAPRPPGTTNPNGLPPPGAAFSKKGVTVSLTHATARDILDALVAADGGASWVARYGSNPLTAHDAVFVLMSFDGQGLQLD